MFVNDNYPKYEIILGESGQIPIEFNAGNSRTQML